MKQSKKSHTKRHIWFYEFERLWLLLTLLNLIALFFIIRGSTAPLIFDNDILRFLFYSPESSDKTLYNIAISYFAAYIFYIIQVYYLEYKKTQKALTSIDIPARNLINQTNMFLFAWETFTKRNSPDDGTILGVDITTIYYKDTSGFVMSANKEELKSIIKRIRDAYNEIINNSLFEQCDNALRQLLLQQNIPDEMENLYKILLSAEMLAQDSSTTILETYSIYTVDDIRTRLKKLDSLLELNSDFNYTITTDENDIRQRKRVDLMGLLMIHENLNYFSRLYKN